MPFLSSVFLNVNCERGEVKNLAHSLTVAQRQTMQNTHSSLYTFVPTPEEQSSRKPQVLVLTLVSLLCSHPPVVLLTNGKISRALQRSDQKADFTHVLTFFIKEPNFSFHFGGIFFCSFAKRKRNVEAHETPPAERTVSQQTKTLDRTLSIHIAHIHLCGRRCR